MFNCWHFNIYEQDKFCAQLSLARKKFYNLGPRLPDKSAFFLVLSQNLPLWVLKRTVTITMGRLF